MAQNLELIRYRRSNRPILKNTRQIYKIHSFINERDFDKMSLVINFSIDKWTESMSSITSSQKCSLIHLVIPIIKPEDLPKLRFFITRCILKIVILIYT